MSETKTEVRTTAPWRWLDKSTLIGDHGRRPVVLTTGQKGKLVQCGAEGLLVEANPRHPDMRLIAGSARLLEAVEAFLKLRTSIFPEVRGTDECSALQELEQAVIAAGGEVPYAQ